MRTIKTIGVLIGVAICTAIIWQLTIHQSVKIDGFNTRKLAIESKEFNLLMCDQTGKMQANYSGDTAYGVVIISKDEENHYSTFLIKKNTTEIVNFTYGNGNYTIKLYKNNGKDTKLQSIEEYKLSLRLSDESSPFRGTSYYTNYGTELNNIISTITTNKPSEIANQAYEYVSNNIQYNDNLASKIRNEQIDIYQPNIQEILDSKKGICLDQASLLASIVRAKGIPAKVAIGYVGGNYHAWTEILIAGEWRLYDSTLKTTYLDEKSLAYEAIKYY